MSEETDYVVLTKELIEAGANVSAYNKRQLEILGVVALKHGWKDKLVGKKISQEDYDEFLRLRGGRPTSFVKKPEPERPRMILDLPPEVQMAIKLRAVKDDCTTGTVVAAAIAQVFPADLAEARNVLATRRQP